MLTASLSRGICPYPANASNSLKNLPHFSKIFIPIGQVEMFPLLGLVQLLQVKAKSESALQLLRRDPAAAFPLPSVMPSATTFCCSPLFQVKQFTGGTWTADQVCCWICVARIAEGHLFLSGKGQLPQSAARTPVSSPQPDSFVTSLKQSLSSYPSICRNIFTTVPLTGPRNVKGNLQLFLFLPLSTQQSIPFYV